MPRTIFENIVIQHIEAARSIAYCYYTPIRFFEVLYIEEGKGILAINNHKVPYNGNQIFIFIPNDQYNLEIETPTTISTVKFLTHFFNDFSLHDMKSHTQKKEWFKKIETILNSANRTSELKLEHKTDKSSLLSLFNVLCNEYNDHVFRNDTILKATLHSILHIIARNVDYIELKSTSSKIQEIVHYLHNYIDNPDLISKKKLAERFNLSKNYISEYFKRQMGIGLKKYILQHKIKLAKSRLEYTDLTVSEIALELGFTDSSHLDKTFLSYEGISAGAYRNCRKPA